jgi:hypothetical protein
LPRQEFLDDFDGDPLPDHVEFIIQYAFSLGIKVHPAETKEGFHSWLSFSYLKELKGLPQLGDSHQPHPCNEDFCERDKIMAKSLNGLKDSFVMIVGNNHLGGIQRGLKNKELFEYLFITCHNVSQVEKQKVKERSQVIVNLLQKHKGPKCVKKLLKCINVRSFAEKGENIINSYENENL